MNDNDHLSRIESILGKRKDDYFFACVVDLVVNGLQKNKFIENELLPNRQDIVQFLAEWSRYAGMNQQQCLDWLMPFTMAVLSSLSRSSPSNIRHGTKSMIRHIYASEKQFLCGREGNRFHARCTNTCRIYDHMATGVIPKMVISTSPPINYEQLLTKPRKPSLKDAYREQFEEALQLIRTERSKKTTRKEILTLLLDGGFKTITGKPWTLAGLGLEIGKMNASNKAQTQH